MRAIENHGGSTHTSQSVHTHVQTYVHMRVTLCVGVVSGMKMEGLFRVPGPAALLDELRQAFEEGIACAPSSHVASWPHPLMSCLSHVVCSCVIMQVGIR